MTGDFHLLWGSYAQRVYRHCLRQLGSPEAAEEVAHRVSVRAWRGAAVLRDPRAGLKWLLSIANKEVLNYLRSERRKAARQARAQRLAGAASSAADSDLGEFELTGVVRAALRSGGLGPREAEILLLRASMSSASWQSIGEHLGISDRGAAKRHLAAIRDLQAFLIIHGHGWIGGSAAVRRAIEESTLSGAERVVIGKCLASGSSDFLSRQEWAVLAAACAKVLRTLDVQGGDQKT